MVLKDEKYIENKKLNEKLNFYFGNLKIFIYFLDN